MTDELFNSCEGKFARLLYVCVLEYVYIYVRAEETIGSRDCQFSSQFSLNGAERLVARGFI